VGGWVPFRATQNSAHGGLSFFFVCQAVIFYAELCQERWDVDASPVLVTGLDLAVRCNAICYGAITFLPSFLDVLACWVGKKLSLETVC